MCLSTLGEEGCGVMRELPPLKEPAAVLPGAVAPGTLVGRRVELARAVRLLDGAQAGEGAALVLVGEPGVGKTRLLGEVCRIAADRGLAVARAGCLPLTTALPFEPILELL